jgi:arylsulfatase A-like enzyme
VSPEPKSLVLVTVDCLRADHCGFYGYSRATTPFLDTLAAESFVVPTAVIAGAPTYYSFPAILASRMPLALGRDVVGLAPGENTLATTLREAGYATGAFSASNPYISPRFGYHQGFEVFKDFLDFDVTSTHASDDRPSSNVSNPRGELNRLLKRAAHAVGLSRLYDDLYFQYCVRIAAPSVNSIDALRRFPSAEAIIDHATSWLTSAAGRPFFLWLHIMDPHSPYYPAAAAFRELTGRDLSASHARYVNEFWNRSDLKAARLERKRGSIVELYDAAIRAMDTQVARLVAYLKHSALWDNCTFVLTADHGEEFLDHGRRYHAPVSLHEEIARVPLLIRVPGSANKKVPELPFSHLHLAPTLLEILDVPAPESFRGTTLWCNLQQGVSWNDPAISESVYRCTNPFRAQDRMGARLLGVRNARHKLVMRVEPGNTEEIYDLEADPKEERPLPAGAAKEIRKQLLQAALGHIQKTSVSRDVTARLKARLSDLRVELQSNSR